MEGSTFKTHPYRLIELLEDCERGTLQLPDFQRSWVWDEDRIKSLVASISRAFPVGALMTLMNGGEVNFKPRPIEGAPAEARHKVPESLLLDGQQRLTSLYQAAIRNKVVETITPNKKKVKRWFYIDIRKTLDPLQDREEAIIGVPEDRIVRADFGREIVLDLSSPEKEYENLMYPVPQVFDWDRWQDGFDSFWSGDGNQCVREEFRSFKRSILENFKYYQVPVIALDRSTTKEAVCVVFEKVNTGGKALDAFELVTAMYAADGHELRKDWFGDGDFVGRHQRFKQALRLADSEQGILEKVANTDFLQAISMFHTREMRRQAETEGKKGKELPFVTGNRHALLNLPLSSYKKYEHSVEEGFLRAAKFLHMLHIYRVFDLPYQSQVIALASVLADIGDSWEHDSCREKLRCWFWNGVFGELYGSAIDTRLSKDFMEVPIWLKGGPAPTTVSETLFRSDRLKTMRSRLSAAYKGMNALLMQVGAKDWRSGQSFDHTVFFGENVDIHHIFPRDWCEKNGIQPAVYDSIINKTPLSYRTNRIIGGSAPSEYLKKLETGDQYTPAVETMRLEEYLRSHLIEPSLLREDRFYDFMEDRQLKLLGLIESATGKTLSSEAVKGILEDGEEGEYALESELSIYHGM